LCRAYITYIKEGSAEEITRMLNRSEYNGTSTSMSRLQEMGFIDKVESLGTSFVITQKGIRAAKGLV
jgi:hypothetical protein